MKIQLALAIVLSIAIKVNQLRHFPLKAGAAQINFLVKNSYTTARQTFPFPLQNAKKKKKSILFVVFSLRCISCNLYILQRYLFTDICGRVSDFNGKQVQLSDTWPEFN